VNNKEIRGQTARSCKVSASGWLAIFEFVLLRRQRYGR